MTLEQLTNKVYNKLKDKDFADKQGRMLVPPTLREYAGLEKEVVFAGVGGHIEIWDKSKWDDVTSFDDINDIAEELSNIGISF